MRPDREVQQERGSAAPEPERATDDQDTEGLAGERHGLRRDDDPGAQDDEQRAGQR